MSSTKMMPLEKYGKINKNSMLDKNKANKRDIIRGNQGTRKSS